MDEWEKTEHSITMAVRNCSEVLLKAQKTILLKIIMDI